MTTRHPTLRLELRPYHHADAIQLVTDLYREQLTRYGRADPPDATDPTDLAPPTGRFFVGYTPTGLPIACGGWRMTDATTAEIKRVFVTPRYRAAGHGQSLLDHLETTATTAGASRIVLETGTHNTGALKLFIANRYTPIPSYVPDRDPAINRAMTKHLHTGSHPEFPETPSGDVH